MYIFLTAAHIFKCTGFISLCLTNNFQCLTKKKKILSGISAYFNPMELIAIMGPSGEVYEVVVWVTCIHT